MTSTPRRSLPPSWVSPTLETTPLWTERGKFAYDVWLNVSIGVWIGQATLPAARSLLAMSELMHLRFPAGRSSIVFVLDQLAAPTDDARAELDRIYQLPGLACTAVVLEGSGFWASAIRSMTTNQARGRSVSVRADTSIDDVVAWVPAEHQQRTGVVLPPDDFKRALVYARRTAELRARG